MFRWQNFSWNFRHTWWWCRWIYFSTVSLREHFIWYGCEKRSFLRLSWCLPVFIFRINEIRLVLYVYRWYSIITFRKGFRTRNQYRWAQKFASFKLRWNLRIFGEAWECRRQSFKKITDKSRILFYERRCSYSQIIFASIL